MTDKNNESAMQALKAIAMASVVDFPSPIDWGQWTRELANAAVIGNTRHMKTLIKRHTAQRMKALASV